MSKGRVLLVISKDVNLYLQRIIPLDMTKRTLPLDIRNSRWRIRAQRFVLPISFSRTHTHTSTCTRIHAQMHDPPCNLANLHAPIICHTKQNFHFLFGVFPFAVIAFVLWKLEACTYITEYTTYVQIQAGKISHTSLSLTLSYSVSLSFPFLPSPHIPARRNLAPLYSDESAVRRAFHLSFIWDSQLGCFMHRSWVGSSSAATSRLFRDPR